MEAKSKVVIRMKSGELIKGLMTESDLDDFMHKGAGMCEVVGHHNTKAICVAPLHVSGLFIVETFEGRKPSPVVHTLFTFRQTIVRNIPLILSTSVVGLLTVFGIIFLL